MFDPTKPVQTRDGRKARIICSDRENTRSIVALIGDTEHLKSYQMNGRVFDKENDEDLINIPEKHVRYLNFDEHGRLVIDNGCYEDKKSADFQAGSHRTACIRVEFESGQFDE